MSTVRKIHFSNGSLNMPSVGLGTWEAVDENELENALDTALELGYRHIDTAWLYENEKSIGNVLKKWFSSGKIKREDIFITTKLPMIGVHPDRVESFLTESLKNLQLDYVDLYLIHFPIGFKFTKDSEGAPVWPIVDENGETVTEGKTDHIAVWKKMEDQVDNKLAKAIGLSNYTVPQIDIILKSSRIKPSNLQIELNLCFQQKELVEYCKNNGVTITAYSPLGNPGYNKFLKKIGEKERQLPEILGNPLVLRIAEKYSKSPAQVALRFLLQKQIAVVPKSVTSARIKENFNVFDFSLSEEDMNNLLDLDLGESGRICDFSDFKGLDRHPDYFPK